MPYVIIVKKIDIQVSCQQMTLYIRYFTADTFLRVLHIVILNL